MNAEIVATLDEKYPEPSHWASLAKVLKTWDGTLARMGPDEIAKLQVATTELIDSFDGGQTTADPLVSDVLDTGSPANRIGKFA